MNYFINCLKKYVCFKGRARRSEYCWFVLISLLVIVIGAVLDNVIGTTFKLSGVVLYYGYIACVLTIALILPFISVSVRRFHDTDRSAWWLILALIPILGQFFYVLVMFLESSIGDNKYGKNPKGQYY